MTLVFEDKNTISNFDERREFHPQTAETDLKKIKDLKLLKFALVLYGLQWNCNKLYNNKKVVTECLKYSKNGI